MDEKMSASEVGNSEETPIGKKMKRIEKLARRLDNPILGDENMGGVKRLLPDPMKWKSHSERKLRKALGDLFEDIFKEENVVGEVANRMVEYPTPANVPMLSANQMWTISKFPGSLRLEHTNLIRYVVNQWINEQLSRLMKGDESKRIVQEYSREMEARLAEKLRDDKDFRDQVDGAIDEANQERDEAENQVIDAVVDYSVREYTNPNDDDLGNGLRSLYEQLEGLDISRFYNDDGRLTEYAPEILRKMHSIGHITPRNIVEQLRAIAKQAESYDAVSESFSRRGKNEERLDLGIAKLFELQDVEETAELVEQEAPISDLPRLSTLFQEALNAGKSVSGIGEQLEEVFGEGVFTIPESPQGNSPDEPAVREAFREELFGDQEAISDFERVLGGIEELELAPYELSDEQQVKGVVRYHARNHFRHWDNRIDAMINLGPAGYFIHPFSSELDSFVDQWIESNRDTELGKRLFKMVQGARN